MNEIMTNIRTRRSVRAYTDRHVPKEDLELIMDTAQYSPSGRDIQSPIMVCVRDWETKNIISRLNASVMGSNSDPFYGAPELIVVFSKKDRLTNIEDGSSVITNILNTAHSLGIDTCWIHRARETFETEEGRELMKQWGISDEYIGIGNVILGYHSGDYPETRPRKPGRIVWVD